MEKSVLQKKMKSDATAAVKALIEEYHEDRNIYRLNDLISGLSSEECDRLHAAAMHLMHEGALEGRSFLLGSWIVSITVRCLMGLPI